EGETSRPRLPKIRPLPTPQPPPRRRNQLAQPTLTSPNSNPTNPTQMIRASKLQVWRRPRTGSGKMGRSREGLTPAEKVGLRGRRVNLRFIPLNGIVGGKAD